MKTGKVWLVGAGPGDAGLLTRKAYEVLQQAEVIVYDALVSLEILCELPAEAKKIYVGKRAGQHAMPQEQISQLLLTEAKAGHLVARLKGGDPFVFGRGGEELALLAQENIPYEVIPGITSAIAAPAYAGIPITHRDYASSFHVVTGHTRAGGEDRIDYEMLAKAGGTLLFLMGVQELRNICDKLQQAGMDGQTPAAIIENGTTYQQRKLLATLSTLAERAAEKQFRSPSVIMIGEVTRLMNELAWREKLPLFGKQCIVTRPREQAKKLSQKLKEAGACVLQMPAIEIQAIQKKQEEFDLLLQDMSENFFEENWIVLSSPSDVEIFYQLLAGSAYDLRTIGTRARWAVVGRRTADALRRYGIRADFMPDVYDADSLAEGLKRKVSASSKVYVFKSERGSSAVQQMMTECGIPCSELVIYRTVLCEEDALTDQIWQAACAPQTYVTFTSASCVDGFIEEVGETRNFACVQAVCIGKKTAERAKEAGMQVLIAREASVESMVDLLKEL